ncbi:LamG-like jellyroll fold domain-containing protein [Shewanella sp. YIC-542]|uniref:LamG-like jellyroll fold domain-containing protein n=1 Tax=Shewanella mytili TaxID=3377111 RepID=UPI00398EDBCB
MSSASAVAFGCKTKDDDAVTDVPMERAAPDATSSFGIAVLPDTQFYARYATQETGNQFYDQYLSEPFNSQTTWIAQNARRFNIPFTIHLGDVVDQANHPQQWDVANEAMGVLEFYGCPYSVLAGNHDMGGDDAYLKHFSPERAAKQATFQARDPSGYHEYHIFEAQGVAFMVLSLSMYADDQDMLWANQVIAEHPELPVILSTHQLLNIDKDGKNPLETEHGVYLWENLIRKNDQIFMTLNGHHHGAARLTKVNDAGNKVEQMVVDYQMAYQGGNSLMRYYEFDLTNNKVNVISFSPWVPQKPYNQVNSFDIAVLSDENNQFTLDINFAERFKGFDADFASKITAPETHESFASLVLSQINAAYESPEVVEKRPATNADDYPVIAETVAHWRFNMEANEGSVATGDIVVQDISGNGNDLYRQGGTDGDILWSKEHHYLSANSGSVFFNYPNKNVAQPSFLATNESAPANQETFENGYTIEAFIKIGRDWTEGANSWINMLARAGNRGGLNGFAGGDPEASSVLFAISSLREIQWEVIDNNGGSPANWSGEVMPDTWLHVAVVNNPETRKTVMYVEGAPILRNSINTVGLATNGGVWKVGGGYWDGADCDPFYGNIGEIRMTAKPLAETEWLTARKPS